MTGRDWAIAAVGALPASAASWKAIVDAHFDEASLRTSTSSGAGLSDGGGASVTLSSTGERWGWALPKGARRRRRERSVSRPAEQRDLAAQLGRRSHRGCAPSVAGRPDHEADVAGRPDYGAARDRERRQDGSGPGAGGPTELRAARFNGRAVVRLDGADDRVLLPAVDARPRRSSPSCFVSSPRSLPRWQLFGPFLGALLCRCSSLRERERVVAWSAPSGYSRAVRFFQSQSEALVI